MSPSPSPPCLAKLNGNILETYKYLRALCRATKPLDVVASSAEDHARASVKIQSDNLVCVTIRTIGFFLGRSIFLPSRRDNHEFAAGCQRRFEAHKFPVNQDRSTRVALPSARETGWDSDAESGRMQVG